MAILLGQVQCGNHLQDPQMHLCVGHLSLLSALHSPYPACRGMLITFYYFEVELVKIFLVFALGIVLSQYMNQADIIIEFKPCSCCLQHCLLDVTHIPIHNRSEHKQAPHWW